MRLLTGFIVLFAALIAGGDCTVFSQCDGYPEKLFVYGHSCQSYIYCNGELSFESSCPTGLAFNAIEGTCDNPENVDCDDEMLAGHRPLPPLPGKVQPPRRTTRLPPTRAPPARPGPPSPTDRPIVISRPEPNHPPLIDNGPIAASPTERPILAGVPNQPVNSTKTRPGPPMPPDYSPSPSATTISTTTPIPTAETPLEPSSSTVIPNLPTPNGPYDVREQCLRKSGGYFADFEDCHSYYRCVNGFLTKLECPNRFGWDVEKKACTATGCYLWAGFA